MRLILIIGTLATFGCTSRQESKSLVLDTSYIDQKPVLEAQDTGTSIEKIKTGEPIDSCQWFEWDRKVTPSGNYISYDRFDKVKYRISWGNKGLKRVLPDTFYCDAPPVVKPHFEQENKDYLMLGFGCGTSCWGSIYLPLNIKQPVTRLYYEYAIDLNHHLVATLDQDSIKTFIAVHNLKTGNIQEIKMDTPCESAIPTYCLDSISINGKYLYYRWLTDWKTKRATEQTVKIR